MSEYPILPFFPNEADSYGENPRGGKVTKATLAKYGKEYKLGLAVTSKMPCPSWPLQAWSTCAGARKKDGSPVDACAICYAMEGMYIQKNVKEVRERNAKDWRKPDWVNRMVAWMDEAQPRGLNHFRWFDSGDIMHIDLAKKIYEVMKRTPNVKHWLPTRTYKFTKYKVWLDKMAKLDNVVVRYSSDSIIGQTVPGKTTSTIAPMDMTPALQRKGVYICPVYDGDDSKEGRKKDCDSHGCRACWSKKVKVVCYPAHGKKADKHVSRALAEAQSAGRIIPVRNL